MTNVVPIGTKRRRYTKREKVTATIAAEMTSIAAAAEQTGIPETNIRRWKDDPALAEYGAKTREEVAEGFKVITGRTIDRILELIPTMEPRDLIILAGVSVDKGQLLSGLATSRTETVTITDALSDHEKAQLADAIDEWLKAGDVTGA